MNEPELIARYFAPLAGPEGLGLADDAALLTPPPGCDLVLTTDALVGGIHFFADDPPGAIAAKALGVNLSDLAAKGAEPLGFLLSLALPPGWTERFLADFCAGLDAGGAGGPRKTAGRRHRDDFRAADAVHHRAGRGSPRRDGPPPRRAARRLSLRVRDHRRRRAGAGAAPRGAGARAVSALGGGCGRH